MHIFYIPSWYPGEKDALAGIFLKEQAIALSVMSQKLRLSVSLWGQDELKLAARYPVKSIHALSRLLSLGQSENRISENLSEFFYPALLWNHRYYGYKMMLNSNLINLQSASKRFGKPDLIHAHVSYPAGYAGMYLSQQFNIPFIITEHMGPFPFPRFVNKNRLSPVISRPLSKAKMVIAVSSFLAAQMRNFGIRVSEIIPNFVDEDFFTPGEVGNTGQKFIFFTLGKISPEKGIKDLLEAIRSLKEKERDVEFRIGGTGPFLDDYKKLSENYGLQSLVKWLGQLDRESAREEYRKCSCFILPSHHESFGTVLIEAIACGKPVISAACGGPEDIVSEINGILIKPKDYRSMSKAMEHMLNNISDYKASAIREEFLRKFSKIAVSKNIIQIYEEFNKTDNYSSEKDIWDGRQHSG